MTQYKVLYRPSDLRSGISRRGRATSDRAGRPEGRVRRRGLPWGLLATTPLADITHPSRGPILAIIVSIAIMPFAFVGAITSDQPL